MGIFLLIVGITNVFTATLGKNLNLKFIFTKYEVIFVGGSLHFLEYLYDNQNAHILQTKYIASGCLSIILPLIVVEYLYLYMSLC